MGFVEEKQTFLQTNWTGEASVRAENHFAFRAFLFPLGAVFPGLFGRLPGDLAAFFTAGLDTFCGGFFLIGF